MLRGNGQLILLVDDEEPVRKVTRYTLEMFGYRVLVANDGAQAAGIYTDSGQDIDLVLIDMVMPVLDGPKTIQFLKKANPEQRIVGISGKAIDEPFLRDMALDAAHFLAKPFDARALLSKVAEVLR